MNAHKTHLSVFTDPCVVYNPKLPLLPRLTCKILPVAQLRDMKRVSMLMEIEDQ